MTRSGRLSWMIYLNQIFALQYNQEMLLVNNFDEKRLDPPPNIHWVQSEPSGRFRIKVLLLYFQQCWTVQSHSQSLRLNPLTGEGVCLRTALTAGTRLSVLAMPFKSVLADLHSGFLLKSCPSTLNSFLWPLGFWFCFVYSLQMASVETAF